MLIFDNQKTKMKRNLYEGLKRLIFPEIQSAPALNERRHLEDIPTGSDQIRVVYTPIGYIRAGERILTQMYEERKRRLEG
mgnify:CR=1 FL=1